MARIFSYLLYFIFFAGAFFLMGRCIYNNPKKMKYYQEMEAFFIEEEIGQELIQKKEIEKTKMIIE